MTNPAVRAAQTAAERTAERAVELTIQSMMERVVAPLEAANATLIAAHAAEIQALEAAEAGWRDAVANGETYRDQAITAEARADRLAAAVRLLLPFVDRAAGEGLEWMEDCDSPRMDPVDLCTAAAEALGMELGDDAYSAILKQGQDEIRAARAALPEAITPKETSDGRN